MELPLLGKLLLVTGLLIAAVGLALMFFDKVPLLGKLPGDIHIKKDNVEFYLPLTTSILISVVLSLLYWLVSQFMKK